LVFPALFQCCALKQKFLFQFDTYFVIFNNTKMNLLTKKEEVVLGAIKSYFEREGKMPTIREIHREVKKKGLKIRSLGSIFLYLKKLEEKGFLNREAKSRGIRLLKEAKKKFINVPILGTASAGSPAFFAEENIEGFLKISKRLFTKRISEGIFAVEVSGNSMDRSKIRGKNIESGDFVLVDSECKDFQNGDKVLATIDGLVTVKNFVRLDDETVGLFPESSDPSHKPIYLTPEDDFVVNGKVIDVLKTPVTLKYSYA